MGRKRIVSGRQYWHVKDYAMKNESGEVQKITIDFLWELESDLSSYLGKEKMPKKKKSKPEYLDQVWYLMEELGHSKGHSQPTS